MRRLLVVVAALLTSGAAFGSGFSIFEQGAKATAMGGAFAATADDPSAIFYNVAGIAQIRRTEFNVGGTAINFSNQFTGDANDTFASGSTGFYRRHTFIPPNAYVVVPIGQLESRLVAASRVKGFDLDPIGTFDGAAVSLSSKSK